MGFYSSECKCCSHPLLCKAATNEINGWMKNVVVVTPDGSILKGEYDGYGNLLGRSGSELGLGDLIYEASVYHEDCWVAAGKPMEYQGPSRYAADQGWFFGSEHDMASPLDPEANVDTISPSGPGR